MGRVSLMMSLEMNVLGGEEIYPKTAGQLKVFSPGVLVLQNCTEGGEE